MTSPTHHRDTGIDAVRGLAIWMVMISHIALWFYPDAPERYWLALPGQIIALPVFFFLSARMRRNASWRALAKRVLRFSLITIIGTILLNLLRGVPLHEWLYPENHFFWFFIVLMVFELIGTAIMQRVKHITGHTRRYVTFVALTAAAQVMFAAAYRLLPDLHAMALFDMRNMWPCYTLGMLCVVMPRLVGLLCRTAIFIGSVAVLAAAFLLSTAVGSPLFIIGTIGAVIASCRVAKWLKSASIPAVVGRWSLWEYILHPFLLVIIYYPVNQILIIIPHHLAITCSICVAFAGIISLAIAVPIDHFAVWRKKRKFASL